MKLWRFLRVIIGMVAVMALLIVVLRSSSKDTPTHFAALHTGMTKQEVADVMGLPVSPSAIGGPADAKGASWPYRSGTVTFTDDKVDKLTPAAP